MENKNISMLSNLNWRQLSIIQTGGVICLPIIMIGQILSQTYGFMSALFSILIGNAILLIFGLISAKMGYEKRKTTPENAFEYFGEKGVFFFALTMVLSLLGWFAIQINMMTLSVLDLLSIDSSIAFLALNIGLGLLITGLALFGIKVIGFFADLSMPFLIATLGYALFTVDLTGSYSDSPPFSISGVSLVIAVIIARVIDLPTYFRHAKTPKDGMISAVVIFGFILPLVEVCGVYLASGSSQGTIFDALKGQKGFFWNIWIAFFLILTCWISNNLNLYSGVACLESILRKQSKITRTLLFGTTGTLLSCFNLFERFENVLNFMGILTISMGTVIITSYLIAQLKGLQMTSAFYREHLLAWLCGIGAGICGMLGMSLTYSAVLDASIAAGLGTCLILIRKKPRENAFSR